LDRLCKPISGSLVGAIMEPDSPCGASSLLFAGFRLEPDGSLFRGKSVVHLPPRELAALRLLLANVGQIVTPSQLKQALWGDVHVTADSVPKCLSSLRARLQPEDCIQTVYKRGYRLMAEVRGAEPPDGEAISKLSTPRLAIPPFVSGVGVPEHLGIAVAEETIVRLSNARSPYASILARDSVFTLAARGFTAQQIGEALHADLVLAGTIRAISSQFMLRVEMICVADGVQIWVEDLLVERTRIAELESDLADRLDFRLTNRPIAWGNSRPRSAPSLTIASRNNTHPSTPRIAAPPPRSAPPLHTLNGRTASGRMEPVFSISAAADSSANRVDKRQSREAYEAFLRGHQAWQSPERHRMQDGLQQLTRAIELDPSLIPARVDLIHLCLSQAFYGYMTPQLAADLARRAAEQIPDLPHRAPEVLPALGWIHFQEDRNLEAASRDFEMSAHLPHNPSVTRARSLFALSNWHFDEAIDLLRTAIQADPFSPSLHGRLSWALHLDGQTAESVEQVEKTLALYPEHVGVAFYGAIILAFNGNPERGEKIARDLASRHSYLDLASAAHAYSLACAGREIEARAILERLQWLSRERFVLKSFFPAVHVALGDYDSALVELDAANENRCPWFFQMLADPRLKPLHGRTEFRRLQSILPRMEAACEQRALEN